MKAIDHKDALKFILAGKAIFTVLNPNSGNRFTFKIKKAKQGNNYFASVLSGTDNNTDYTYIGHINSTGLNHSAKSKVSIDSKSFRTLKYVLAKLDSKSLDSFIEVYHEGKCGRCGRKLTTPDSILSGFGPECIKLINK